jgi:hypothetical protein
VQYSIKKTISQNVSFFFQNCPAFFFAAAHPSVIKIVNSMQCSLSSHTHFKRETTNINCAKQEEN